MSETPVQPVSTQNEQPAQPSAGGGRSPNSRRRLLQWMLCAFAVGIAGLFVIPATRVKVVKQWTAGKRDPYPCLYVTSKDVARAKAARQDLAALKAMKSFNFDQLDSVIAAALLAENPDAEKAVTVQALKSMDELINAIPSTTVGNIGPHAYAKVFGQAVGCADAALAAKTITAEERANLLAKIARACDLVNDPKYFNPDAPHGSMCPNMFTSAAAYRLTLAALIPSHPKAKEWFNGALAELKQQLDDWVDPQGGMAECPHYSMVIFDQWVGAFLIARNAGAPEDGQLFNPKLRKAIEWFGNISTPRDVKNSGFRRQPTIGHTYANERTSMFGVMACLWKEKDRAFAAEMQWMHREHGNFTEPGILSYYPAFMGYRSFFQDSGVAPSTPAWTSRYYQETGVQLRNVIGSDRETTLYMIAGRFHSHYYNDSGSITLWGKGRELCDEDNYQYKRAAESREAHSMPDKPATYNEERVMELKEFSTSPHLDYVRGMRRGWQRQIAFVKDADPLGPNYFVMADTLDVRSAPTVWRLFLASDRLTPFPQGVTMTGKDDVDLDVFFLRPGQAKPVIANNHIALAVEKSGTVTVLLYPRLKTEKRPEVTSLADGQGVKVVTPAGTDIVYLNPEPVKTTVNGKAFDGKVCLVKERNGRQVPVLPGACDVPRDFWTDGDPQLRRIHWQKGPQYPYFPDYDEAVSPNPGNVLVPDRAQPAAATDFRVAITGAAPKQRTDVAVNWDANALDVAFTCADTGIVAAIPERDNIKLWKDDGVYVWLDPGHTHNNDKNYIMIQVSAGGTVHDLKNSDPAFNVNGLKVQTARTKTGWSARLRIPWNGLGVATPVPGDVWGVNFTRMDQPGKLDFENMQMSSWVALPNQPGDPTELSRWGHLVFGAGGDAAPASAAQKAIEKTHRAIIDRAYTREVLLKTP